MNRTAAERDATPAGSDRRAELIREHFRETGVPPTSHEVAERNSVFGRRYYETPGVSWTDVLRAAGVPACEDVVADYLRECFETRHDWQEFITRTPRRIARETGLSGGQVGHALSVLGDADAGPLAGFALTKISDTSRPNWKVERVDAEEDGGSA